jgi:hypothetical protein
MNWSEKSLLIQLLIYSLQSNLEAILIELKDFSGELKLREKKITQTSFPAIEAIRYVDIMQKCALLKKLITEINDAICDLEIIRGLIIPMEASVATWVTMDATTVWRKVGNHN